MKKLLYLLTLSLFVFTSCENDSEVIDLNSAEKQLPKVDVCHYDEYTDTWKTISISENAVKAHLKHGDRVEGGCEDYTYVPDDGFEKFIIYNGWDDILDNYVLTSRINTIENLHFGEPCCTQPFSGDAPLIPGYSVSDFTGIGGFSNLKYLEIVAHDASILDLSQNIALLHLNLREYSHLQSINLTNNTNLKTIGFTENYGFTSVLDLSNCIALEYVSIGDIDTGLNIKNGNNTSIIGFNVERVGSNFTCIQVDDADWSTANWNLPATWTSFSENCP